MLKCIERVKNYAEAAIERAKGDDRELFDMIADTTTARILRELAESLTEDL